MGLNVYLKRKKWTSFDAGETFTEEDEYVYEANITHNLGEMAAEAEIYEALWRPEEMNAVKAGDIIKILEGGLAYLKTSPHRFIQHEAPNGWGTYENFVPFVEKYLEACKEYPGATIVVSR